MIFSKSPFCALLFVGILGLVSCTKGDEKVSGLFLTGVFITNEGPTSGTGTVSYYDRDADIVKNDIFGSANNGATLGVTLQPMGFLNGVGYLLSNGSNKIITVDTKTFTTQSTLATGLTQPRYFLHNTSQASTGKAINAYVTQAGTDSATSGIAVFDYTSNTVAKIIATGKGADRLIRNFSTNAVIVLNKGNATGKDSTIAYVNSGLDSVVQKVVVGIAPNGIVQDANADIWVTCAGETGKNNAKLVKVRNNAIEFSFPIPAVSTSIITDKSRTTIYFVCNNQIYIKDLLNFGANAPTVFMKPSGATNLYALGWDARTGLLWCGDAMDNKQAGTVYIINPETKEEVKKLTVGVVPNGFVFQ